VKKLLFAFALLISFLACEKSLNTPISEDKLVDILIDLHTAEAAVQDEQQRVRDSMTKIYYQQIFDKHQVSKADFDTTLATYSRHPIRFDTVYNHVLERLKQRDSLTKF
jgi:hypothetical protein